ncbi:MAG: DUF393 domain-containing protein [Pseudomonadota bacterium]
MAEITLFYDGACPLCRREIALMRRLDRRGQLSFENVAELDAPVSCTIDRNELLAQFHARLPNGQVVRGARAFCEAYGVIPYLGWVRTLGRIAPTRWLLDCLYRGFLRLRPIIQRMVARADQGGT